ncbi:beta-phosphoglucomutase [Dyadobacter jejuensis]|uniref:Beta-phosphoglucomutase n=1 Tax=Dyadobacter jejuensis TaxID=1082580 RepID=A0A316B9R5_9BACT|nr:beta-phosphoglucomutase [Dyadobacter jejuensis]PWJ59277.1 beta-phosphoglucomutase [Dyadobacter jejuensis]
MSALQACLFDLDGVIVDTAQYHYIAWRELAQRYGFDLTLEQNELLKGIGRMESLDIILKLGEVDLPMEERVVQATIKNERYLELCQQIVPSDALPGVHDFLKELQDNDIKIGLGSASKNAPLILERLQMTPVFEALIDGNRVTKGKPDPQVFLLGAQELGVDPAATIVFEDALAGVQAGNAAGMKTVGIGQVDVLSEADMVLPGFEALQLASLTEALGFERIRR